MILGRCSVSRTTKMLFDYDQSCIYLAVSRICWSKYATLEESWEVVQWVELPRRRSLTINRAISWCISHILTNLCSIRMILRRCLVSRSTKASSAYNQARYISLCLVYVYRICNIRMTPIKMQTTNAHFANVNGSMIIWHSMQIIKAQSGNVNDSIIVQYRDSLKSSADNRSAV